jgi:preprotein translocase subunit SecE
MLIDNLSTFLTMTNMCVTVGMEPPRRGPFENHRMANVAKYLKESKHELGKVIWPNKNELTKYSLLVIGVSLVLAAFMGGVDLIFSSILEHVLGL